MALKFPVIFLLPANLESEEMHELEEQIPTLTYDINEAEVVIGKVARKQRALFELRKHKLVTEEVPSPEDEPDSPRRKRTRTSAPADTISDTASDNGSDGVASDGPPTVKVVKLAWFTDSLKAGEVLPLDGYVVYKGHRKGPAMPMKSLAVSSQKAEEILKRAMADSSSAPRPRSSYRPGRREGEHIHRPSKPPLLRQSTTEHDIEIHLPPIPEYLHTTYSCQRPTPVHPPNERLIEELMKIRTARTLVGDRIGVRAYSSAIATLSAYPYTLSSSQGNECP